MYNATITNIKEVGSKLNVKMIIFFGFLLEIIYLIFNLIEPLKKILRDGHVTPNDGLLFLLVIVLLLFAFILYILTFKLISLEKKIIKLIIVFFLLFNITLLLIWPVGSADIFLYIYQGKTLSTYHLNPFSFSCNDINRENFFYFINNKCSSISTLYGPLFIIISGLLTFLGGEDIIFTLFLFKLFFIILNILNFYLIYKIFNNIKPAFLYGWNPFILYEFSLNGHNDVLVVFFLLLCFYFLYKKPNKIKSYSISLFFLILSVLIKFITIVFVPIFFLIILFKLKNGKEKLYFTATAALITIITFFILYFPFWRGWETITKPITHSNHIYSTLKFASPGLFLICYLLYKFHLLKYLMAVIKLSKAVFILLYTAILISMVKNRHKLTNQYLIKYSIIALSFFYIFFFTWFMPWYLIILIFLLICYSALTNNYKLNKIIYGISIYGILYYCILR